MIEGKNIICFAPSDYWAMNPSCAIHIMRRFSKKNKVLYINPFSSDLLGGVKKKKGLVARIVRKLKSIFKYLREPEENLYIFSPVFLPLQGKTVFDKVNNILLKLQIKMVCRFKGIINPILWLENVRAADMMDCFKSSLIVYHVSDLFANSSYTADQQSQHRREERISNESDLVICVSKELYALKKAARSNVFYIPHGVDFDLFREAALKKEGLEELKDIPKPIAGYFGTMTDHNDIELLLWCARNLPDVSFVFAGQVTGGDYSQLRKLDNVYLLGRMKYEKIPGLCACFDMCMLQWRMSEWIECCNPLKMFEYMASGRPIVSIPIKEVMQYSDIVSIAHNKEEFCDAIRWELDNDTPQRAQHRIEIARKHNWEKNVEKISEVMIQSMSIKQERMDNKSHPDRLERIRS